MGLKGLNGLNGLMGLMGLMGLNGLMGLMRLNGLNGLMGLKSLTFKPIEALQGRNQPTMGAAHVSTNHGCSPCVKLNHTTNFILLHFGSASCNSETLKP